MFKRSTRVFFLAVVLGLCTTPCGSICLHTLDNLSGYDLVTEYQDGRQPEIVKKKKNYKDGTVNVTQASCQAETLLT